MRRVGRALLAGAFIAVWAWLLTAFHGLWSFGVVLGYLDGGRLPLSPGIAVTPSTFFLSTLICLPIGLVCGGAAALAAPRPALGVAACLVWLVAAWAGASQVAFEFQIDFGTTWAPGEAFRALFYHPVVTPLTVLAGLLGTLTLIRWMPPARLP